MVKCSFCPRTFDVTEEPGAILLSSPESIDNGSTIRKYHICQECEQKILDEHQTDGSQDP